MNLKIQEVIGAVGGRLLGGDVPDAIISSISTDTRKIAAGSLFIPLVGENFDGHDYILQAAENGAICVLTERQSAPTDMDIPIIYVSSTRRALMDLADFYRRRHKIKVAAIAGSAGKTTTKDMVADILSQKFKTKRTIKNFNNDIGMPLSIFQLEPDDEVLVLEMGMNHAGEVHELSLVAAPDVALITYIGDEHMENFESREGVLRANLEVVDGLREGGTVILNGNDPLLTGPIAAEKTAKFNVLFPGNENILSAEPIGFLETRCRFAWRGKEICLTVPVPGEHMVQNALLAAVCGLEMSVSPAQITAAFESFTPPEGRLNIFEAAGKIIIDDVYNANPDSMIEAIKVLCRETTETAGRRRVAILGDMNELGHVAEARHREAGRFAAKDDVDFLVTIGPLSRYINESFLFAEPKKEALHFESAEELLPHLSTLLKPDDIVLIKASRGMKLERITKALKSQN